MAFWLGDDLSKARSCPFHYISPQQAGTLLHLPRQKAGWEWMSFFVRRLQPGDVFRTRDEKEEAAFVFLGGTCDADWGQGEQPAGKRKNVFDGLPYTLYLPAGNEVSFTAETSAKSPSAACLRTRVSSPIRSPRMTSSPASEAAEMCRGKSWTCFPPHFPPTNLW